MKLSELAKEPQLIKCSINKPELVEKYGEELEFYIYDRQPLDVFARLANAEKGEMSGMTEVIKMLILDEEGKPIVGGNNVLPMDVLVEAVSIIGSELGK